MRIRTMMIAAACFAGCGDDGGDGGDEITITMHAYGAQLLAVQPAGGDWQAVPVPASGDATVTIPDGPYAAAVVCDEPDFFDYYTIYSGAEERELDMWCKELPGAPLPVTVSVAASTTADVYILGIPVGALSSWQFAPGTYDIVAYDRNLVPPRYQVQRDVTIDTDLELGFDLAQTGTELEPITVTTDANPDETASISASLVTANGTRARFSRVAGDDRVWRIPAPQVVAGDAQVLQASALSADGLSVRSAQRRAPTTAAATVALPGGLSGVAVTWDAAPRVTWQAADAYDDLFFYAADPDFTTLWDVHVRPSWIAATGESDALAIPDPTTLPGWRSEWNVSPVGFTWWLSAERAPSALEHDRASMDGIVE